MQSWIKGLKFIFRILTNKNFLPLLLVLVISIFAARRLLFERGYFIMHDDLQMMRQLEMEKCFRDGQIPCRWAPDMGYGLGLPVFNYYPPLPYLIGESIRLFGISFVETVKLTFALSLILSGISMYFLSREFFGRVGGVLSAAFYVWAPYRAVDIYVRGAMNESWAFIFFPLIFLFSFRLIIGQKSHTVKNLIFLALSYFGLFMSHNIIVLIFTPFFVGWVLVFLWKQKNWDRLPDLSKSIILAFGLSAFFLIPVFWERNLVYIENLVRDYYDYNAHFVSLNQLLFSRFWGYGGSIWGPNDGMSFQIGHLHWIFSLFVGILLILLLVIKRSSFIGNIKSSAFFLPTSYLLIVGWTSAFMTHPKSAFIWKLMPTLRFAQFPWRFLTITVFAFSFIIGFLPGLFANWQAKKKLLAKLLVTPIELWISSLLILGITILNWNYFLPANGAMGRITDEEKFSGLSWVLQQKGGISDYLPLAAKRQPNAPSEGLVDLIEGKAEIENIEQGTYWVKFNTNVESESAVIRVNVFKYPNWRIFSDNKELNVYIPPEEEIGRMYFAIPNGEHLVYGQLFNTWPRTLGNIVTLFSWIGLIGYWRLRLKVR